MRDDIELADEHAKTTIVDLPQTGMLALRLGVIDLPSFYGMAGEESGWGVRRTSPDSSRN